MKEKVTSQISIVEITPHALRCGIGACPALFETNRDTVIVVGAVLNNDMLQSLLHNKVGEDEMAVEIPKKYLKGLAIK